MGKQQIQQKETVVSEEGRIGQQLERTLTVDDNILPSPQEMEAYKEINPDIVSFLLQSTSKEQGHRHEMEEQKLDLLRRHDNRQWRMNWWGMFFAFCSIVVTMTLAGFALYLNRPWFSGIMGLFSLVTIVSVFIKQGKSSDNENKKE